MATELQRRFKTSSIKRLYGGCIMGLFSADGLTVKGCKRLFNSIAADMMETWSEPQIKYFLLELLQCYDVGPAEKAEALKLLQMAETTLTAAQTERILFLLSE